MPTVIKLISMNMPLQMEFYQYHRMPFGTSGGTGVYSFVGSGQCNNIVFNGPLYKHSVVAGGYGNTICNSCNFIGGGCNNLVSGAYSAILGGSNNTDSGYAYTGMFGCGLAASNIGCAFWVNEIVVNNIPCGPPVTFLPAGALYYCCVSVGCCIVLVK